MTNKELMGSGGLAIAVIAAIAMSLCAFLTGGTHPIVGETGICLPSVNSWNIIPWASWIINILLILGCGFALEMLNKEYNFVPGDNTLLPASFLVAVASMPWISGQLTSSMILALANIICMSVLFASFRSNNATQTFFLIATILSFGSMIEYAFIFMIPVYIISGIMLKCFRIKEFLATGMGLIAPYWIGIGLGLIPIDSFALPTFSNLFDHFETKTEPYFGIISIAIIVLITLIMSLQNIVRLYAGNSRRRLLTMAINMLGLVSVICMVIDYNNIMAYIATAYMVTAVTFADFFTLRKLPWPRTTLLILLLLFISAFIVLL
jgi:hypothetical protein